MQDPDDGKNRPRQTITTASEGMMKEPLQNRDKTAASRGTVSFCPGPPPLHASSDRRLSVQVGEAKLSAEEQHFASQMTDMMEMEDMGGQSLIMDSLTEEQANALDADEPLALPADAGSSDEQDLVTFLQVRQGMPRRTEEQEAAALQAASQGLPLLNMGMVGRLAINNTIIVTWASWSYYQFALNIAAHMQRLGVKNFLIGMGKLVMLLVTLFVLA